MVTLYFDPSFIVSGTLTLSCSANERTEMKLKIYLSEAWMCSEFGYQRPMSNKKGLIKQQNLDACHGLIPCSTIRHNYEVTFDIERIFGTSLFMYLSALTLSCSTSGAGSRIQSTSMPLISIF